MNTTCGKTGRASADCVVGVPKIVVVCVVVRCPTPAPTLIYNCPRTGANVILQSCPMTHTGTELNYINVMHEMHEMV